MSVSKTFFDETKSGEKVFVYKIENGDYSVGILDYGATLNTLVCPDKNGKPTDIILGFDRLAPYEEGCGYMGATVGRFANRIEKGKFTLDGKEYTLFVNDGPNHLHGGKSGFNSKIFDVTVNGENSVTMSYVSPDGEEGYPGTLNFSVTFTLNCDGKLLIEYNAETDKDTIVNFTNHSYFNLFGADSGLPIDELLISVNADSFCENDTDCLPTGKIISVDKTDMDLRKPVRFADRLSSSYKAISDFGGFDNCFIIHKTGVHHPMTPAAELFCPENGILLKCETTLPAIQVYSGNGMSSANGQGKYGTVYRKHGAVCLETQNFPNSTTHKNFPSPVLKKGEKFNSKTVYTMSVDKK